ncbi:MAG: HAD-IIIA family hydrolase [Alphaproteobacteria bacterium]|jgi:D-glycero-D-manno-heptose 1,7-bisphosphate phosphatase
MKAIDHIDEQGLRRRLYSPGQAGSRPALFLDRDGTIIEDSPYLSDPALVRVIPEAAVTIAAANRLGLPVVVITNQSGIGRGLFDWPAYSAVEDAVAAAVAAAGAHLDAVYACPQVPAEPMPYGRKPDPGMLTVAAAELGLDLSASWVAGDCATDIEAGLRAGLRGGWLVPTGYGARDAAETRLLAGDGYEVIIGESLDGLAERLGN